ncbi:MAG: DUF2304 domain-containing protein [Nanoarchaeota archaeon]|nr:DUF2304 domain-containing protein [Nanoarchaeota archaeon]
MIIGIQLMAIIFILIMIYLTFLYYKKSHYSAASLSLWMAVWLGALLLVLFPETLYGIMETLKIERTVDFFVISGFMFFTVLIFYLYNTVKQMQRKMERLVRKIAIDGKKDK